MSVTYCHRQSFPGSHRGSQRKVFQMWRRGLTLRCLLDRTVLQERAVAPASEACPLANAAAPPRFLKFARVVPAVLQQQKQYLGALPGSSSSSRNSICLSMRGAPAADTVFGSVAGASRGSCCRRKNIWERCVCQNDCRISTWERCRCVPRRLHQQKQHLDRCRIA